MRLLAPVAFLGATLASSLTWAQAQLLPADRAFDRKKRVRRLYRRCPPGAAAVCFDEWEPLEPRPRGGITWARQRRPARMRATHRRPHGTEHFLGFYDVPADCTNGVFRQRKRIVQVSEALRRLRACYPTQTALRDPGQLAHSVCSSGSR